MSLLQTVLITPILLFFLIISSYTDIKHRKVYNFVTLPTIILGLGFNFINSGLPGLKNSVIGLGVGFLFLFIFYLLGGIGAGDVKFMAAIGALKGTNFVVMGGFYGAILGGIVAIFILLAKKNLISTFKKLFSSLFLTISLKTSESLKLENSKSVNLPYTAFLSLGMIIQLLINLKK